MSIAIALPELGAEGERVGVSAWLVEPGDAVTAGDRLVEVLVSGVTFDVSAPCEGRLERIERHAGARVRPGDVLGWIAAVAGDVD